MEGSFGIGVWINEVSFDRSTLRSRWLRRPTRIGSRD